MQNMKPWLRVTLKVLTYVLVAALASGATLIAVTISQLKNMSKLDQLEMLIDEYFIGEVDKQQMYDGAAYGMIAGLGDQWSQYIPAAYYATYVAQMESTYVGIGVTIKLTEDGSALNVQKVEPDSGAQEAGILAGDKIIAVEGQKVSKIGIDEAGNLIRGEAGTSVKLTLLREEKEISLSVKRKLMEMVVAEGQMLEESIGLVTIYTFHSHCAEQTLAVVDDLLKQGAKALVFDVRNNPGGYVTELVKVLDRLLPQGDVFISENYAGEQSVEKSDAKCLELPMAVLVNGESYSAAEFFAAVLEEYDWAFTVGEQTVGKSYFQITIPLNDGSAVALSVGKYKTPKGVVLAEVGGITPTIVVEIDEETAEKIYTGEMPVQEDPQIQAAVEALKKEIG